MLKERFHPVERINGFSSDNLINYNAGPINFKVCPENFTIVITNHSKWASILPEILPTLMGIWGFNEANIISKTETEVIIMYDIIILSKYLEYNIVFY